MAGRHVSIGATGVALVRKFTQNRSGSIASTEHGPALAAVCFKVMDDYVSVGFGGRIPFGSCDCEPVMNINKKVVFFLNVGRGLQVGAGWRDRLGAFEARALDGEGAGSWGVKLGRTAHVGGQAILGCGGLRAEVGGRRGQGPKS